MHTIIDGDGLLYQAAYGVKNVQQAYDKFVDKVQQLAHYDWDQTGDCTIFIEGRGNWRKDVFDGYKAPRKKAKAVDPNKELRWGLSEYLRDNHLVVSAVGLESDDLVRRKAETMYRRGQPYVVASADKDLDMVCGHHLRFNTKWEIQQYEITKAESDYNFFLQLMIGDMQDNIKSPRLLGKKTAEKLLAATPRDQWRAMVEREYKERCGSEWLHALYFTGSLVYIQESQGQMFNWDKRGTWFDLGFEGAPSCYDYTDIQLGG